MIKAALRMWRKRRDAKAAELARLRAIEEASDAAWGFRMIHFQRGDKELARLERAFGALDLKDALAFELIFAIDRIFPARGDGNSRERQGKLPPPYSVIASDLPEGMTEAIARGAQSQGAESLEAFIARAEEWGRKRLGGPGVYRLMAQMKEARPAAEGADIAGAMEPARGNKRGSRRL